MTIHGTLSVLDGFAERFNKTEILFVLKFDENGEIDRLKTRLPQWVDKVTVRLFFFRAAAMQIKVVSDVCGHCSFGMVTGSRKYMRFFKKNLKPG